MTTKGKNLAIIPVEDSLLENSVSKQFITPEPGSRSKRRLPDHIRVYYSVRKQGAHAGRVDWFYVNEVTGKRYRSRREVFREFDQEVESSREPVYNTPQPSEATKAEARAMKPKSVTWIITEDGSDEGAIPLVDGVEVPKEIRRVWAEDFEKELDRSKVRR